jgi:hypothetical protein
MQQHRTAVHVATLMLVSMMKAHWQVCNTMMAAIFTMVAARAATVVKMLKATAATCTMVAAKAAMGANMLKAPAATSTMVAAV